MIGLSRQLTALFLTLLLGALCASSQAGTSQISRQDIQNFLKQPGNAILNPDWQRLYSAKTVKWRGTVYKIDYYSPDEPVEVLIKVLPNSYLYDTVLLIPAHHPVLHRLSPGQTLAFEGVITGGVDNVLVKEVHITLLHDG